MDQGFGHVQLEVDVVLNNMLDHQMHPHITLMQRGIKNYISMWIITLKDGHG